MPCWTMLIIGSLGDPAGHRLTKCNVNLAWIPAVFVNDSSPTWGYPGQSRGLFSLESIVNLIPCLERMPDGPAKNPGKYKRRSPVDSHTRIPKCWQTRKNLLCAETGCRIDDLRNFIADRGGWWENDDMTSTK